MKTWNLRLEELEARIAPDAVDGTATETILRLPGSGSGGADEAPDAAPGQGHGQGAGKDDEDTFIRM